MVVLVSRERRGFPGQVYFAKVFASFAFDGGEVGEVAGEHLREGEKMGDTSTTNDKAIRPCMLRQCNSKKYRHFKIHNENEIDSRQYLWV